MRSNRLRRKLTLEQLEDRLAPATFVVNTTLDTLGHNNGQLSFRQAILDANASPEPNTINIPASDARHFYYKDDGVAGQVSLGQIATTTAVNDSAIGDIDPDHAHSWWSIQPTSVDSSGICFDVNGGQVTVDGTSQPGYAGTPNIELNGSAISTAGTIAILLDHTSNDVVRGLAINRFPGPALWLNTTDNSVFQGNFIGTDISGRIAQGNGPPAFSLGDSHAAGMYVAGNGNVIGSNGDGVNDDGERNLISGNVGAGLVIGGADCVVAGNYIGTDITGSKALPNGFFGLYDSGDRDRIGTSGHEVNNAGERNLISGNGGGGIVIFNQSNVVAGNYIGTDVSGTTAIPNGTDGGIFVRRAYFTRIGTDGDGVGDTAERNIIAGINSTSVTVGEGSHDTLIAGNFIGIDANGQVLENQRDGVRIEDGVRNRITRNAISVNVNRYIGIDLGVDGATPNDPGDADVGPNNLQNYPVLTDVRGGGMTHVAGSLNSLANTTFTLEFFASAGPGAIGQRFLRSVPVTTDGAGNASFDVTLAAPTALGEWITATATEETAGNTSEFSQAVQITTTVQPGRLQGLVWQDFNNDGQVDFSERAIEGVAITLTGTDYLGNPVQPLTVCTDNQGIYEFLNVLPGTYTTSEAQPTGFADGRDTLGTVNNQPSGDASVNDRFSGIVLPSGGVGVNFNFGERPTADGTVHHGQTATIGYWHNKNGQDLINSLNGGPNSTQLGNWLAATLPHLYGAEAGANNLTGKTNAQVAAFYLTLFGQKGPELDAQVLAVALASYVTNQSLAGSTAAGYGFQVTANGVGYSTFNIGSNGAAFGVANNTTMTVLDILLAADARTRNGLLYDQDGSGTISATEQTLRDLANQVFTGINEQGDI